MSIDNEFDAFSGGVSLGGLRNTTHIKILVTYLVKKIKEPMKDSMIIEALQVHELANYFEAVQHLAFMEEERAYCQGYVDCIQLLGGLGMLNSNPDIEMIVSKMKK